MDDDDVVKHEEDCDGQSGPCECGYDKTEVKEPSIIPTEQVRADQIKEGDRIACDGDFYTVEAIECTASPGATRAHYTFRTIESATVYGRPSDWRMLRQAAPAYPVIELLRAQLDEMRLHEDTGDPSDEGYMNAIRELDDWLASQENTGGGS